MIIPGYLVSAGLIGLEMLGWGVKCWGGAARSVCANQNSAALQPDSSTSTSPSLPPRVYKCALLLGRVSAVCMRSVAS